MHASVRFFTARLKSSIYIRALVKGCGVLAVLGLNTPLLGGAAELRLAQVTPLGEGFRLRTEVLVAAPASEVREALASYERLPSLNPNIENVEVLPADPNGATRLLLRTKTCVLFVCQRYEWVQRVTMSANGDIIAVVEPLNGDLRSGAFHYQFRAFGKHTLLITDATVEPVTGLSGGWLHGRLMRYVLGNEALTLSARLEQLL